MNRKSGYRVVGQVPNFPLPPKVNVPQVYAQNPGCDVPNIDIMAVPQCNDPRKSIQLNKRIFEVTVAEFWVLDNGANLQAGFGTAPQGKNPVGIQPADLGLQIITDAQTRGTVRDITIQFDSYAEDYADPRNLGAVPFQNYGVFEGEVGRSFAETISAFLSGTVVINNQPFPTKIPLASAIKHTGGMSAYWDFGGIGNDIEIGVLETDDYYFGTATTTLARFNQLRYSLSPEFNTTHTQQPAPIEIDLPASSQYAVQLEIPTRTISLTGFAYPRYSFIWTGMISILIEKSTNMGTVQVNYGASGAMAQL